MLHSYQDIRHSYEISSTKASILDYIDPPIRTDTDRVAAMHGLEVALQSQSVASIAQWIEHWSRKPGVVSSILTGGSYFWQHSAEGGLCPCLL